MTYPLDARYGALDPQTAATVAAAFGRDPFAGGLTADDEARLDAIIEAVAAGQVSAAGHVQRPETPAEAAAPELPEPVTATTGSLRQRIRDMDDLTRAAFLTHWAASDLPQALADSDGADLILDADEHHALERLIADHEPPATNRWAELVNYAEALPNPLTLTIRQRLAAHGINRDTHLTTGRATLLAQTIIDVEDQHDPGTVAATLGPVADGRIITEPVTDASDLAATPPAKGTIDELLAWVGGDAGRAGSLFDVEMGRSKPRKGLVDRLSALMSEASLLDVPVPAPAVDAVSDAPPVVEAHAPAGAELSPAAILDRLAVDLADAARIVRDLAHLTNSEVVA